MSSTSTTSASAGTEVDGAPVDTDDVAPDQGQAAVGDRPAGRLRRTIDAAVRRPLVTVALAGVAFVLLQAWWIARARHIGGFDVDEAGGVAAALRFRRAVGLDPRPLVQVVFDTRNGPLVALMSVPFLMVWPRSVVAAMVVQPVLVVVTALGVAGSLKVVAGRHAAVVGGVVMLLLPVSVVSSRSYQYSTGVGAFLALAMWALLASRRGTRLWPVLGFGAATGAMLLCRTMSVSFLPALAVAAALLAWKDLRAWKHLVLAGLVAFAVAGPWWIVNWGPIMDYLLLNAYGPRAHYWGNVRFMDRVGFYRELLFNDFMLLVGLTPAVALVAVVAGRLRKDPDRADDRPRLVTREVAAVGAALVLVYGALLSTSNQGFWFAYPADALIVVLVVGLLARGRARSGPWGARVLQGFAALAFLVLLVGLVAAWRPVGAGFPSAPREDWRTNFTFDLDALQLGNLEADARMASASGTVRARAARDWYDASLGVARQVGAIQQAEGPVWQSLTGEIHLFNVNTLGMAEEASGTGIAAISSVNTLEPPDAQLRKDLTPTFGGVPRVLVLVDGRSLPFPDGRDVPRYRRLALEEGWVPGPPVALPDGGDVVVYTHPDSLPEASRG
ncbi:MAG: hypothetical protein ACKO04_03460 [Actinomycetes bacterium]